MKLAVPDFSLIILIGASGAGKSSFAARHFRPQEVLSVDAYRGIVSDDEASLEANDDALALIHDITAKRLKRRKLVVVDAPNLRATEREALIDIANKYHAPPVAIVIDPGRDICQVQNASRTVRRVSDDELNRQLNVLGGSLSQIDDEGFRVIHTLNSAKDILAASVVREPVATDKRHLHGPFDVIGDVHGCMDELADLMTKLGYTITFSGEGDARQVSVTTPPGRIAVFVGDLVDRGPNSPDVLRLVMQMVREGQALCVPGNHDNKLMRWLRGNEVKLSHGLEVTVAQLENETDAFREEIETFVGGLRSHVWLDEGRLAVAHAGLKEQMLGRMSRRVYMFCLYGETSGETDEFGLPVRYNWAAEYAGETAIIYGHTPVPEAAWQNNTLCLDTGCCFGGKLTALRWPEREIVSVPAKRVYAEPIRPFGHPPARPPAKTSNAPG